MKNVVIKLSKYPFTFGNCATGAMAHAFDVSVDLITNVFKLMGSDCKDGCTYNECRKMIYFMGKSCNKEIKYIKWGNTLRSFINRHKKGKYLILEDIHLSYYENGIIHDSYKAIGLLNIFRCIEIDALSNNILGAWEITDKVPTSLNITHDIIRRAWERKIALKV